MTQTQHQIFKLSPDLKQIHQKNIDFFKEHFLESSIKDNRWWKLETSQNKTHPLTFNDSVELVACHNIFYIEKESGDIEQLPHTDPMIKAFSSSQEWEQYVRESLWNHGYIKLPPFVFTKFGAFFSPPDTKK